MESRWARLSRGMLASGVAIFVAALFHVAGGGAAPGPLALALSVAFATLGSVALTARRLSLWRLVLAVGLSQFLFHLLFSLGGGAVRFTAPGGMEHLHPGAHLTMTAGAMTSGAMPTAHTSALSPSMWLTHTTAVLVTVIVLRFGEQAFWGLFETARLRIARAVERLVVVPVTVGPSLATPTIGEPAGLRDLGLPLARLRHRGPPALARAF